MPWDIKPTELHLVSNPEKRISIERGRRFLMLSLTMPVAVTLSQCIGASDCLWTSSSEMRQLIFPSLQCKKKAPSWYHELYDTAEDKVSPFMIMGWSFLGTSPKNIDRPRGWLLGILPGMRHLSVCWVPYQRHSSVLSPRAWWRSSLIIGTLNV